MEIVIDYKPRAHQLAYHDAKPRFKVLVDHRRSGKTTAVVNQLIKDVMTAPPFSTAAYIAPLRNQAKRVAWPLLQFYTSTIPGVKADQAELLLKMPGNRRLYVLGSDNPDAIRGVGLVSCAMDETAQMDPSTWRQVVRPALADAEGAATFIGTPAGRMNLFHDLYEEAESLPGWWRRMLTVKDSGETCVSIKEQRALKREMRPEEWEQEFMCSFNAAVTGSFYGKEMHQAEDEGRITSVEHDRTLPVVVALDLGMSDLMVAWVAQLAGNQVRLLKSISWRRTGLPDVVEDLAALGVPIRRLICPHDIRVQEMGTGVTRLETLRRLGCSVQVCPNLAVEDGIEAVRNLLSRSVFDREGCKEGIEALVQYHAEYDEVKRVTKPRPVHDWSSHAADAFRYLAVGITRGVETLDAPAWQRETTERRQRSYRHVI